MAIENDFNLPKHNELKNYTYFYYINMILNSYCKLKENRAILENIKKFSVARTLHVHACRGRRKF